MDSGAGMVTYKLALIGRSCRLNAAAQRYGEIMASRVSAECTLLKAWEHGGPNKKAQPQLGRDPVMNLGNRHRCRTGRLLLQQ